MGAAASDRIFILERSIVALLLLTGRLMRREDVAPIVLQSLRMLLMLKPQVKTNQQSFIFRKTGLTVFYDRFYQKCLDKFLMVFTNY